MAADATALFEKEAALKTRNKYFVINPNAGKGISLAKIREIDSSYIIVATSGSGDARSRVRDLLKRDPSAWIIGCGGDGTLSECVAGIIDSDAGNTALFSAIGAGSGNDFVRYMEQVLEPGEVRCVDAVSVNGHYSINMVNIGFDCEVVLESERLRRMPNIKGSTSYILGAAKTLIRKPHIKSEITVEGIGGTDESKTFSGDYLLTCVAECPYCGGGFKSAPTANPFDGLIDLLIVSNVSRLTFVKLVKDYKAGTHFLENGELKDVFKKFITHVKCKSFNMSGVKEICVDGEVIKAGEVKGEIRPNAFNCILPEKKWIEAILGR